MAESFKLVLSGGKVKILIKFPSHKILQAIKRDKYKNTKMKQVNIILKLMKIYFKCKRFSGLHEKLIYTLKKEKKE